LPALIFINILQGVIMYLHLFATQAVNFNNCLNKQSRSGWVLFATTTLVFKQVYLKSDTAHRPSIRHRFVSIYIPGSAMKPNGRYSPTYDSALFNTNTTVVELPAVPKVELMQTVFFLVHL